VGHLVQPPCQLSQLRNISGAKDSAVQEHGKCSKGFMEPENWMMIYTLQSNNHATEFAHEGVGGGQAQPQYICRAH